MKKWIKWIGGNWNWLLFIVLLLFLGFRTSGFRSGLTVPGAYTFEDAITFTETSTMSWETSSADTGLIINIDSVSTGGGADVAHYGLWIGGTGMKNSSQYLIMCRSRGGTELFSARADGQVNIAGALYPRGHVKLGDTTTDTVGTTGDLRIGGAMVYNAVQTFDDEDTDPDVSGYTYWNTNTTAATIDDFDGSGIKAGQLLIVVSKGAITYDVTTSGIKGGTTDIITAAGDVTTFIYDGTDWLIISRMDMSDDLN